MRNFLKTLLAPENRRVVLFRVLPVGIIFLLSLLLLSYSLYFLHVFQLHGSVTSFFPWRWGDHYNAQSSVSKLFDLGLGVSVFFLLVSSGTLFYLVRSFRKESHVSSYSSKQSLSGKEIPVEKKVEVDRFDANVETARESILSIKREKTEAGALVFLHKRLGKKSRTAAITLLVLCIALVALTYRYQNVVLELNAVIAFVAGLILLFKDQRHTVQLRVLNKVIESAHEFMESAGIQEAVGNESYSYVPAGETISDIVVRSSKVSHTAGNHTGPESPEAKGLVPIGRGLAELFQRELSIERPTLDDILASLPAITANKLNLAAEVKVVGGRDVIEIKLFQPTLTDRCLKWTSQPSGTLYCEMCSMMATLVSHASRRVTFVEGCTRDEQLDTSTIRIKLGEEYEKQSGEQIGNVESNNS